MPFPDFCHVEDVKGTEEHGFTESKLVCIDDKDTEVVFTLKHKNGRILSHDGFISREWSKFSKKILKTPKICLIEPTEKENRIAKLKKSIEVFNKVIDDLTFKLGDRKVNTAMIDILGINVDMCELELNTLEKKRTD